MPRAALTLFLVARHRVFRADFARVGSPPAVASFDRPDAHELTAALDAALPAGAQPGRASFVLSADFWIQSLGLPADRSFGLSDAEAASALNFEAEVLSGLPAFEATAAAVPLQDSGRERRFLLLQVRTTERDNAAQFLHASGSRLGGLLHPAGLPRGLGAGAFGPRVELWPDAAVAVRPTDGGIEAAVSNADPITGRWRAVLPDAAGAEVWTAPGIAPPAGTEPIRLEKLETLTEWFAAWAAELTRRRPAAAVPVVRVPVPPRPVGQKAALAALLAALAAGAAFAHWTNYSRELADERRRAEDATNRTKQLANLEGLTKARSQERDKAAEEAARLGRVTRQWKNQQERYVRLLGVLAERKPAEVVLQKIEAENGEPKLVGVALRSDQVDEFARDLTPAVRPLGWEVRPPHKAARGLAPDGGPWSFEIGFRAAGELAPAAAAPLPAGKRR